MVWRRCKMKILTNKQINYILRLIADCQLIAKDYIEDDEAYTDITKDLSELSVKVGGPDGASTVINIIKGESNNG